MDNKTNTSSELTIDDTLFGLKNLDRGPMFMESFYYEIAPIFRNSVIIVGVFGVIANILTLVVYVKMGFSETIHMSYVALAVSDLGCVLTILWMRICYSLLVEEIFRTFQMRVDTGLLANFTGGWPNNAFSRTTALLTAWVSLERCISVNFPTKVKIMITPKVTKVVLTVIYIIGCCPVIFVYVGLTTVMNFDPVSNYTTLLLHYNSGNRLTNINRFVFVLYGVIYPLASWILVTICAAFLIVKLKRSLRWRAANSRSFSRTSESKATSGQRKPSNRESRVNRTVVMIACAFIIFTSPSAISIFVALNWREFSLNGSLHYPFMLCMSISFLFTEINSSINVIVYAITGSKFRSALLQLLPKKCCGN
ncbi:peptide receptor GPCR [Elysia marginata]|uniref:Peptide receptor GPCR n=1 Tax=Elysia marginata TaxID=1093978 RepID=A0AAV4HIM2_9GAST|nr:peptide receptor GPCR [Elysia marginata]